MYHRALGFRLHLALIGELSTRSDEFRTRWGAHDVRHHGTGSKTFHHPVVGALELPCLRDERVQRVGEGLDRVADLRAGRLERAHAYDVAAAVAAQAGAGGVVLAFLLFGRSPVVLLVGAAVSGLVAMLLIFAGTGLLRGLQEFAAQQAAAKPARSPAA